MQMTFYLKGFIGLLFCLVLGLLSYLSFFNCPSVTDDFCFSVTARDYGFWTAQKMYYDGWSGRYFTNFLFHINPLAVSVSRTFSVLFPFVLFFGFLANLFFLFKNIFDRSEALFLSLSFFVLTCLNIRNIYESFYWYSGTYTLVSANLVMLFLTLLIKQWRGEIRILSKTHILMMLLLFLILGSSEITMLAISAILIGLIAYFFINRETERYKFFLWFLPVILIGNYFVFTADGNDVRQTVSPEIGTTLLKMLKYIQHFLRECFFSPLFIVASAAWLMFLNEQEPKNKLFDVSIGLFVLLMVGVLCISFFLIAWGLHEAEVPPRLLNMIYIYFLLMWAYLLGILTNNKKIRIPIVPSSAVLMFLCLLGVYRNETFRNMVRDIRYETAAKHLIEYEERLSKLNNSAEENIILEPYKHSPATLYNGDLRTDPTNLWNKCYAQYFKKKQIITRQ